MSCGIHLDSSMDIMEETRFKKKHSALIQKLTKELHFNFNEMESLMLIYYKLQKDGPEKQSGMTKNQLRSLLHCALDMTDEDLVSDIVMTMVRGVNPIVPMEVWAKIMSLFLRGTFEERVQHCFMCYNLMNDGKIGRDIMLRFLSNSLTGTASDDDSEDAVKDLIELLSKKMDWDRDGKISFDDFRSTCLLQPLLMQYLGPCLPSRLAVHTFLTTFTSNVGKL